MLEWKSYIHIVIFIQDLRNDIRFESDKLQIEESVNNAWNKKSKNSNIMNKCYNKINKNYKDSYFGNYKRNESNSNQSLESEPNWENQVYNHKAIIIKHLLERKLKVVGWYNWLYSDNEMFLDRYDQNDERVSH